MKTLRRCLFVFVLSLFSVAPDLAAADLPEFRPALLSRSPRSLVNLINADSLMKRGQKDGLLMFSCYVSTSGRGYAMQVYRCSPGSELLQKEVLGRIKEVEFEPAVYHHNPIDVWLSGTINFFLANGKPHLRVLLNQEEQDLKSGSDFVAPQFAFARGNPKFQGIYWPPSAPGHEAAAAVVLDVDTTGKVTNSKVAYEHPPGLGFGAAVAGPIRDAIFIPGFRNGKLVPCHFTWTLLFFGPGLQMKSG
jgi:hypothetical protein